MSIRTKAELKELFETGDKPNQQAFIDLIDTLLEDYHSSLSTGAHGGIVASNDIRLTDDRNPLPHSHDSYLKSETYSKTETDNKIQAVVGAAPEALNTLEEIGTRLEAEETIGDALTAQIAQKANSTDVYTKEQTYSRVESDAIWALKANASDATIPVGTIVRGGPNTPTGFTPCNGTLLNKTVNPELYTAIGDTYSYLANQFSNGKPWENQPFNGSLYKANAWSIDATVFPVAIQNSMSFVTNGYAYIVGGKIGTVAQNTVYRAPINLDGTISNFTSVDLLPETAHSGTIVIIKNYAYMFTASLSGVASNKIYRAIIYQDGTISSFTQAGTTSTTWTDARAFITINRIYLIGADSQSSSIHAIINSDGSLGAWSAGPNLPTTSYADGHPIVIGSRVYYFGGYTSGALLVSNIGSDGVIGAWTSLTNLTVTVTGGSKYIRTKNNVYIFRASNQTFTTFTINEDGTLGAQISETSNLFPVALSGTTFWQTFVTNSKVYILGNGTNTIYVSDFTGGANNYLQDTYTIAELADSFFVPDLSREDSIYSNTIRHYIKL